MSAEQFVFSGATVRLGDNIDTDAILPAEYLNLTDPKDLALHCLEKEFPDFRALVTGSPIVIAGKNFGCGSSREHAPVALAACGAQCVIARSFSRLFFRNALNVGLPVIELEQADEIAKSDSVEVDFLNGTVRNLTTGKQYPTAKLPSFMQELLKSRGLLSWIERRLAER